MNSELPLRLMIPGPVSVAPEVQAAMGAPVQPHYGPRFRSLYFETLERLKDLFHTSGEVFLLSGSGTAGIDACFGSAFHRGETVIVASNGFFGLRLIDIAQRRGLNVIPVWGEEGQPLEVEPVLEALQAHPEARGVAAVHLETSTTILNPIGQLGKALRGKDVLFVVDAVSSLGGIEFRMEEWGVDLAASATQKCLGAPPGLSPVAVSQRAWERITRQPEDAGWFTDLRMWKKYMVEWGDWHPTPVTMNSNLVTALNVALRMLAEEGIEARLERYRQLALQLRAGLERIGLEPYTPVERMNAVLTAAWTPVPSGRLVSFLEQECRIKISSGLGAMKEQLIRIGHMSPVVTAQDIDDVIDGLERCLASEMAGKAEMQRQA
ncbi:MAG TPA: alanine--glyoxylate aminotransferase family protein [Chloroflexi bacterium]|jgi:alanine-glyoxylate transaminase/serine-glyoxylate transaminase/serine-pyruvate transaminase|nr:alanine--glyoxylate aminotransferase family protein [Chloroflexota bacterium]HPO57608.1 alanine--glyoxylate aminotransferase family protein [Anaerolineaceae bacterium]